MKKAGEKNDATINISDLSWQTVQLIVSQVKQVNANVVSTKKAKAQTNTNGGYGKGSKGEGYGALSSLHPQASEP